MNDEALGVLISSLLRCRGCPTHTINLSTLALWALSSVLGFSLPFLPCTLTAHTLKSVDPFIFSAVINIKELQTLELPVGNGKSQPHLSRNKLAPKGKVSGSLKEIQWQSLCGNYGRTMLFLHIRYVSPVAGGPKSKAGQKQGKEALTPCIEIGQEGTNCSFPIFPRESPTNQMPFLSSSFVFYFFSLGFFNLLCVCFVS